MTAVGMKENEYVKVDLSVHVDDEKPHRYMVVLNDEWAGWGESPTEAITDAADRMRSRAGVPA